MNLAYTGRGLDGVSKKNLCTEFVIRRMNVKEILLIIIESD